MTDDRVTTSTNPLAIGALVCGVLWMGGFASVAAIVLSRLAFRQIDETGENGRGMAQAGFILGCLGVCFTVLMYAATFSSLAFRA